MDLRVIENRFRKILNTDRGLDFEYKYENDHIQATCSLTAQAYQGDIYADFTVYNDGLVTISFTFDKIDNTSYTLSKIEEFNENSVWLTAYITDKGYLKLRNNIFVASERAAVENVEFIIKHLLSDKIKTYLAPLSQLTHE